MEVEFDYKLFNPIYWHIDDAFKNQDIRNILIYGGSSASKTYSIGQNLVYNSLVEDNSTIIFRKESTSIDDSVYADFKHFATELNQNSNFFRILEKKIITPNGKFRFRGLDDSEKVKGISKYNKVYLNELSSFEFEDWSEIQRRMRGRPHLQIVADWNPISEEHWIKKDILDKERWVDLPKEIEGNPLSKLSEHASKKINESEDTVLIKLTYLDNYWVIGSPCGTYGFYDKHTIANFEKMKLLNNEDYRVYALGEWGRIRTGGEFFHSFDRSKCVKKTIFNPENAIHISVDNNVLPYISVHFSQYNTETGELQQVHEICAEEPFNTVSKAGEMARLWLEESGYNNVVYLYGDASTKSANTIDDEKRSFLDKFIEQLEVGYIVEDRVPKSNPSVSMSGEFINTIWSGAIPGISLSINDTCTKSMHDYENVKKDVNGGILKLRTKNKLTGQSYEEHGHLSDCLRYVVVSIFEKEYIKFSNRRKRNTYKDKDVMNYFNNEARIGYKSKVIFVMPDCNGMFAMVTIGINGNADVIDVKFRDTLDEQIIYDTIIANPDHYVFECNKAYFPLVRELRNKGVDVRAMSEHAKPHHRISANESIIKAKFRFNSSYDSDEEYTRFVNNIMDYNGKDNYEALNILSMAAHHINRVYFEE